MKKAELIAKIAEDTGLTKEQSGTVLTAALNAVTDALVNGEDVQLVGFGTFSVKERAARTCRNLRTNELMEVAASRSPSFKAGKSLKDKVNAK